MKKTILLGFSIATLLISCQKNSNTDPNNNSITNSSSTSYNGVFITTSYGAFGNYMNNQFSRSVNFYNSSNQSVDGGIVTENDSLLTQSSSHDYFLARSTTGTSGASHWSVTGNSANSVPSFTCQSKLNPGVSVYNFDTIRKSSGYTVTTSTIPADTIYYTLKTLNPNISITKYKLGPSANMTFASSDVSSMQGTHAVLTICAINSMSKFFNGKNYRFVNQVIYKDSIFIKN